MTFSAAFTLHLAQLLRAQLVGEDRADVFLARD